MRLSVDISGLDALKVSLGKLEAALDEEDILDEAVAILLNRIRARFLNEEGPNGKWPESKAAAKRKAGGYTWSNGRKWTGTGTLFASGRLFHSIQEFDAGPNERMIGTDVFYGVFHQLGLGQEKREFLGFNEEDVSVMEALVYRRAQEALK